MAGGSSGEEPPAIPPTGSTRLRTADWRDLGAPRGPEGPPHIARAKTKLAGPGGPARRWSAAPRAWRAAPHCGKEGEERQ